MAENPESNESTMRHIRLRPGMYLGAFGSDGLHNLAESLLSYSLAEFELGHAMLMEVRANVDGSLSVADNGAGISIRNHGKLEMTTLEWVMAFSTTVEVRNGKKVFSASDHGVGTRTINALSDWTQIEVHCDGRTWHQRYERGFSVNDVCDIGDCGTQEGTKIAFHPDPEIFQDATFAWDRLEMRLQELAFLNRGLTIKFSDERTGRETVFHYPDGGAQFVEHLNAAAAVLHKIIYANRSVDETKIEIAMQYTTSKERQIRCYANNVYNRIGGTHQRGFQLALANCLNSFSQKQIGLDSGALVEDDLSEGLTAIINVKVPEPQFESQNALRLNNPEIEGLVAHIVDAELNCFLKANPREADLILTKINETAKTRLRK